MSTHRAPLIPLWVKLQFFVSREDWDKEDNVGSPYIFPSIVNCLLAKPFSSWLCSLVFMLVTCYCEWDFVRKVGGSTAKRMVNAQ